MQRTSVISFVVCLLASARRRAPDAMTTPGPMTTGGSSAASGSDDPLYDRAVSTVTQAGFCSISQLQRMRIRTPDGTEVPFSAVAEATIGKGFTAIGRIDRNRKGISNTRSPSLPEYSGQIRGKLVIIQVAVGIE